jgi:TPR repeat protein
MKPSIFGAVILILAGLTCPQTIAAQSRPEAAQETEPYWPAAKPLPKTSNEPLGRIWTVAGDEGGGQATKPAKPVAKSKPPAEKAAKSASRPALKKAFKTPSKPAPAKTAKAKRMSQAAPAKTAKPAPTAPSKPATVPPKTASKASTSAASTADAIILADAQKGCTAKDANACLILGRMYVTGTVAARDEPAAVRTFKQSCDLGNGAGCHALAMMYEKGTGTAANAGEAARYYKLACKLGTAPACKTTGKTPGKVQGAKFNLGELLFPKKPPVS